MNGAGNRDTVPQDPRRLAEGLGMPKLKATDEITLSSFQDASRGKQLLISYRLSIVLANSFLRVSKAAANP